MKCRVLYLIGQLEGGGSERQLYLLLRSINRDHYSPEVFVWNFREDDLYVHPIRALNIPIHFLLGRHSRLMKLNRFRQLVRCLKPAVIHSYSFYTNFAACWASIGTRTIAIGAVRSDFCDDKQSSGFLIARLSARWPSKQIYNSVAAAEKAQNSVIAPRHVFVIQNGLDLKQFRKLPLAFNGHARVLGVGSLRQYKRWDRLVKAALDLKENGLRFFIEIAGAGPLRESLEGQARNLGVVDRVSFIGHSNNIPDLMAASTFIAHPSDVEGCPNVVMEAMACGRAVVATDAGDIPFLVEDGITGFVVRRGDDVKFIERLATLIANRDLCRRMGDAARAKAERDFGLDRLVENTFAAYRAAGGRV